MTKGKSLLFQWHGWILILVGYFLPPQIIYQGKTSKCLPPVDFPPNWHVTFHWANEMTTVDYLEKIISPYIENKRQKLKLDVNYPAPVLFH